MKNVALKALLIAVLAASFELAVSWTFLATMTFNKEPFTEEKRETAEFADRFFAEPGGWKRAHGVASEALPEETGSNR